MRKYFARICQIHGCLLLGKFAGAGSFENVDYVKRFGHGHGAHQGVPGPRTQPVQQKSRLPRHDEHTPHTFAFGSFRSVRICFRLAFRHGLSLEGPYEEGESCVGVRVLFPHKSVLFLTLLAGKSTLTIPHKIKVNNNRNMQGYSWLSFAKNVMIQYKFKPY